MSAGYRATHVLYFDGPLRALFARLTVTLMYSPETIGYRLYNDAALFRAAGGGECGYRLRLPTHGRETQGELQVFSSADMGNPQQMHWLGLIRHELGQLAEKETVAVEEVYACPQCTRYLPLPAVDFRRRQQEPDVICPFCGARSPLVDLAALHEATDAAVSDWLHSAAGERDRQARLTTLSERERNGEYQILIVGPDGRTDAARRLQELLRVQGLLARVAAAGEYADGFVVGRIPQADRASITICMLERTPDAGEALRLRDLLRARVRVLRLSTETVFQIILGTDAAFPPEATLGSVYELVVANLDSLAVAPASRTWIRELLRLL